MKANVISIEFSSSRGEPDAGLLLISAHKLSAMILAFLSLTACSSPSHRKAEKKLFNPIVESMPICSNIVRFINALSVEYDDKRYLL